MDIQSPAQFPPLEKRPGPTGDRLAIIRPFPRKLDEGPSLTPSNPVVDIGLDDEQLHVALAPSPERHVSRRHAVQIGYRPRIGRRYSPPPEKRILRPRH